MKLIPYILFFFGFSSFVLCAKPYEIAVSVKGAKTNLIFPTFKILRFGEEVTLHVENCTYSGKLLQEDNTSISLKANMQCSKKEGTTFLEMPILIFDVLGGNAAVELDNDDGNFWKYSVKLNAYN